MSADPALRPGFAPQSRRQTVGRCLSLIFTGCLWLASASSPLRAEEPLTVEQAAKAVDQQVTVKLVVQSASVQGEVGFLNSEKSHRSEKNFTIFLGKKFLTALKEEQIEDPVKHFKGKTILVTGKVTLHKDKPQIIPESPAAIEIVKEPAKEPKSSAAMTGTAALRA